MIERISVEQSTTVWSTVWSTESSTCPSAADLVLEIVKTLVSFWKDHSSKNLLALGRGRIVENRSVLLSRSRKPKEYVGPFQR